MCVCMQSGNFELPYMFLAMSCCIQQRGELALTLLTHYKDDQDRLARIMDKLLDKEVHQMYKAPSLPTYYINNAPSQVGCLQC